MERFHCSDPVPNNLPPGTSFWSHKLVIPLSLSFLLVPCFSRLPSALLSSIVVFPIVLGLIELKPKYSPRQLRTAGLILIAIYPLIVSILGNRRWLLFTVNISGVCCVTISERLSEALVAHTIHFVLSGVSLLSQWSSNEDGGIDFLGWKLEFMASLLWISAYKFLGDKIAQFEWKYNMLLQLYKKSEERIGDLNGTIQDKENYLLSFGHEFKNLLNALLGNLKLAGKSFSHNSALRSMFVSAEMMRYMVMNILDSGKHSHSSNIDIKLQKVHLPSLLENIWSICAEIISKKPNLTAKITLSDQVPHCLSLDQQRMTQIFLNLVTNAVKFTEKGSIHVKVTWEPLRPNTPIRPSLSPSQLTSEQQDTDPSSFDDNLTKEKFDDELIKINETKAFVQPEIGAYEVNLTKREWKGNMSPPRQRTGKKGMLKISIQDTGSGMSDEQCKKLFERFSQVSEEEEKRQLGTGLGLWITKQIIDKMGGTISVDSKLRMGTRFDISIPTVIEDRASGLSIEIPGGSSLTGAKLLSLNSGSLSKSDFSRQYLTKSNLFFDKNVSTIRLPETRSDVHSSLRDQRWESTTSLDTPVIHPHGILSAKREEILEKTANPTEILIVDDNVFNVELLRNFVGEKLGFQTIVAYSGAEALELLDNNEPQNIALALIDLNLKDMTGIHLSDEIKILTDAHDCGAIPCYLVSGEDREYLEKLCDVSDNLNGYLTKPVDFDELQQIIFKHAQP